MEKLELYTLGECADILEALRTLDKSAAQTLFVVNDDSVVVGSLTDGDIRRALIHGAALDSKIGEVCLRGFEFLQSDNYSLEDLSRIRHKNIHVVPVLDSSKKIKKIIDLRKVRTLLPVDAVIMAGGRGERLRPLTDTTPKPLLPLGDKVIMEYNVDKIASMGIDNVTVCIRYLGEQITQYFGNGSERGLNIIYIKEDKPLGTLGAVTRISHFEHDTVLVMNSDLFTDIDLESFYYHFIKSGADMSVAATPYTISVPYAVMKTEGDCITNFEEKPTYTYHSNAGIYLIKRNLLESLPKDVRIDATELMEQLLQQGGKLTYFPITGYWMDIGTHEEYRKAQNIIRFIRM